MAALIIADGDVPTRADLDAAWPGWDEGIDLVVAADGGARHARMLGVSIDLWVGDGDSLGEDGIAALAAAGVPVERARPDKDQTDVELAVDAAIRRGAVGLIVVGALGGERVDHALANVALLARPDLAGRPAVLLDARSRISLLRAPRPDGDPARVVFGRAPGSTVSLLPFGADVDGVTTDGLLYPLSAEPLALGSARGVSNVIVRPGATVTVRRGLLLVVESPATL
jgi:thiamine pyrophosphokinase